MVLLYAGIVPLFLMIKRQVPRKIMPASFSTRFLPSYLFFFFFLFRFPLSNFPPSLFSLPLSLVTTTTTTIGSAAYAHTCWMDPAASLQGMKYSQSSESKKHGLQGIVFKLARVGERLSGVICLSLICMAVHTIIA
jgi:hypothetical protein